MDEIEELLKKSKEKLKSKKLKEALKLYDEVLIKDENNFSANYDLGIIYLILKNYEFSAKYFEKAHILKPENKDADRYYTLTLGRIRKQFEKPMSIQIETTSLCNARCLICPNKDMKRKKGTMDDKTFKKIVDDCKEMAEKYGIRSIPDVKLFKDGNIVDEFNGAIPEQAIKDFIDKNL